MELARLYLKQWRPEIPTTIHASLRSLIKRCWCDNPEERLSFDEIYDILRDNWFPFYKDADLESVERFIREVET
jgi:hypothetical protein